MVAHPHSARPKTGYRERILTPQSSADMIESLIESLFPNQYSIQLGMGLLLLIVAEVGYRMGFRIPRKDDPALQSEISGYQAAVLGLLALLLGFTFSMALSHYDLRRSLVIQEANAIETTFLRTSFLPPESREASRKLLRDYLDLRMEYDKGSTAQAPILQRTAFIQGELWKQGERAAINTPTPITATYITALNEMFDTASTRIAASRVRVPSALWLILTTVSAFGIWAAGFSAGVNRKRALFLTVGLPILITLVLQLITDISTPKGGLIHTDYSSMVDLRASIK